MLKHILTRVKVRDCKKLYKKAVVLWIKMPRKIWSKAAILTTPNGSAVFFKICLLKSLRKKPFLLKKPTPTRAAGNGFEDR